MITTTNKEIRNIAANQANTAGVEVMGAKGSARFRMMPLNIERVTDLFAANDQMMARQLAA